MLFVNNVWKMQAFLWMNGMEKVCKRLELCQKRVDEFNLMYILWEHNHICIVQKK